MTYDVQAIDCISNLFTPEAVAVRPKWTGSFIGKKLGQPDDIVKGVELDRFVEMMDEAGIEKMFLAAVKAGIEGPSTSMRIPPKMILDAIEKYPDRFYGLAGVDPFEGMRGVKELETLIRDYGFIGAHLYPHWFDMAPDHARYYPIYAKCCELDIPIQMQVGHCLRYSHERPLRSVGRPITLDTIACDFPELKLVGIHLGWPWTEEMIAVAYKHPNVFIGTDAYAPKYWSKEFVHFANSFGQDKVLFGTDFPVIGLKRARDEIEELGFRPEAKRKLLRDNVLKLYGLDG